MIDNLVPEAKRVELTQLAQEAFDALLAQEYVTVTHAPDWERNGYPLPVKRMKPDAAGTVVQEYRPLALLEYVNDCLSGTIRSKEARERMTSAKDEVL